MKKKRLIILLSFLIPIFILTGLALWIVTTDHVITPAYDENHTLAQYFAEETSVVYNGESQNPDVKDGVYSSDEEKENFLNTIEFYYKEYGKVGKYEKGTPTDAGNYSVKILSVLDSDNSTDTNNTVNDEKVEQEGALYVKFNINKANIVPTSTLTVNYDQEGNNGYFTTDKSLSSVTLNGTYVHSSISSLQVGEGKYSYTQDKLTVGNNTTYNFTFTPNNKNYNAYSSTIGITTYATVTYKDYNSTIINTLEVPYGSKLNEPTHSTRNGYTWNGWYNGSTAWNFANNTVTTDMTLIESWTVINYTITYNLNGGTVNGTNPSTYNIESGTITLINPTKKGYTFKGWSGTGIDGMSTSVSFSGSDLENKTFTANWWVPITITLSDKVAQYNESNQTLDSPKITLNGLSGSLPDGASIQYSYSPTTPKDVGDYTVTATLQLTQDQINNGYELVDSSSDLSATLKITQAVIDVSGLSWEYDQAYPYTYSGSTYSVSLNGTVPSGVTVTTSGLSGVNAGDYTATVSFTLDDTKNYALSGSVNDLSWKINKKPVDVSGLSWKYDQTYPYTYSGNTYSVSLSGTIPSDATVTTSGLSGVNAGNYTASATITIPNTTNYELIGSLDDLSWKINQAPISVSGITWNYSSPFTYDGTEKSVGLNGVPSNVNASISGTASATNAGDYTASATLTCSDSNYYISTGIADLTWKIDPMKISVDDEILSKPYTSNMSYTDTINYLNTQIGFHKYNTEIPVSLTTQDYLIYGIHNGAYYYGYDESNEELLNVTITVPTGLIDNNEKYLYGSTYTCNVALAKDSNYELVDSVFIFKYKTAFIGYSTPSEYLTVEDAFKSDGTINFAGNSEGANTYVVTSFSYLSTEQENPYNSEYYSEDSSGNRTFSLANRELIVPYMDYSDMTDENITSGLHRKKTEQSGDTGPVYSVLDILDGITINASGTSMITVSSIIGYNQSVRTTASKNKGVLINNGVINVGSGCTLYSYGYIKGAGIINANNGSKIYESMTVYDWPGGSNATKILIANGTNSLSSPEKQAMPLSTWSITNNACPTIINYGAIYYGYAHLVMSSNSFEPVFEILGDSSSSSCLFKALQTSSYVKKTVKSASLWISSNDAKKDYFSVDNINGNHQTCGQRSFLEIFGDFEDGNFTISLSGYDVSTSVYMAAPLSFVDVAIKSGTLTLKKCDYVFFPGTTVTVESGAALTIESTSKSHGLFNKTYNYIDLVFLKKSTTDSVSAFSKCVDTDDAKLILKGTLTVKGKIGGSIINQSGTINTSDAKDSSASSYIYANGSTIAKITETRIIS